MWNIQNFTICSFHWNVLLVWKLMLHFSVPLLSIYFSWPASFCWMILCDFAKVNVQEDCNILLRRNCVFKCIKFTNDNGIVMLKDRKCGRCNTLSVIICLIVVPRVLHTHRYITSNQLNSMVQSRCWTQESSTFSVFRLKQRLAMVRKQFGYRKCLSFISDTVQYILSNVVSELEN
jgi:hypothetical protein